MNPIEDYRNLYQQLQSEPDPERRASIEVELRRLENLKPRVQLIVIESSKKD